MYVTRSGILGEVAVPPPPSLTSFCATYPNADQCLHPSSLAPVKQGIRSNWGILLGVVLAGFVVYKVAS